MKKIPSLFKRDSNRQLVLDEVTEGCEWVINNEGIATRKWDGTCCLIKDNLFYKRYDAKHGKTPPEGFIPAQEPDPITGHWPGWLLVGNGPDDRWHREALINSSGDVPEELKPKDYVPLYAYSPGTYELCGPKINGNPEKLSKHILIKHGLQIFTDCPTSFYGLNVLLSSADIEGIVWHHPDGRMAKIKKRDFGHVR